MIQKQFAKALDGISTLYMRTQKKKRHEIFFEGGIKEFLAGADSLEPMKYFANTGAVPEVTITKSARQRGYDLKFFRFESFVKTPHESNNTVHGRLYEIHGKPDAPAVVVLHGWHMESYNFFDYYCRLLIRAGFNAVLIDLPYHMNRRAPHSFHGEFTVSDDPALTFLVMHQSVSDVEAAINWLKSRGAPLIGMFGVSYGAMLSGLVGCVEPSVSFMMLVVPPVDLYDFFTQSQLGRLFENQNPVMFGEIAQYKEMFDSISLLNLKPQMSPERIFLALAEYDGMVRSPKIDELWRAWERPYMERYEHGHLSVIMLNPSMNRDMRRWLKTIHDPSANA
ncbi:MAG: hypothetical protein WCX65_04345 [bacterium]